MAIIKIEDLPEKEEIYLKRDIFGYRFVHPIKNPDGTYNWMNLLFGGKRNFFNLIVILIILGFLMYAHFHDVKAIQDNYIKISKDPLAFCRYIRDNPTRDPFALNLSRFNTTFDES